MATRKFSRQARLFAVLILLAVAVLPASAQDLSFGDTTRIERIYVGTYMVGTPADVANGCRNIRFANTRICLGAETDEWHGYGRVEGEVCVADFWEFRPCLAPDLTR